jgi:hypothetical protein
MYGQNRAQGEESSKPRVIITCDPELDDLNSLIRFLLFSNDFRVEGLIYASSQFHWKGDGQGTEWYVPGREYSRNGIDYGPMESWRWDPDERFIDDAVEAYEEVYPNLKVHDPSYPAPEYLKAKIRTGNIDFDGDISKDTPGSELIKAVLLDDCPGPVFINAWGGASTIARALKSIRDIYEPTAAWEGIRDKIVRKVVLSLSGDQDDTYARYIKPFWPGLRQMEMSSMTVGLVYNAQLRASQENQVFYSPEWMRENIRSKGPFGAMYRVWGDGKQMVKGDKFDFFGLSGYTADELKKQGYVVWTGGLQPEGSFLAEGDTYCFLNLINNGLRGHEDPAYGGWCGGKIVLPDSVRALPRMEVMKYQAEHFPLPDFTSAVMNGLAARLKWSVSRHFADANHEPVIKGESIINARPGEKLKLKYTVSDPDKDTVTVNWWQYVSAGTYGGRVSVDDPASPNTGFTVPSDARPGDTIHLILEATDNGTPQTNRYHRLIVTIPER